MEAQFIIAKLRYLFHRRILLDYSLVSYSFLGDRINIRILTDHLSTLKILTHTENARTTCSVFRLRHVDDMKFALPKMLAIEYGILIAIFRKQKYELYSDTAEKGVKP